MIRIAHAAASDAEFAAQCFVNKINQAILFPVITLLLALAFLVFLYGLFEYVRNAASDQGRETGKQHILYGVIGMFVMLSAYSILALAAGTFGVGLFKSDQIVCGAGAAPSVSTVAPSFGAGGGLTSPGGAFGSPGGAFGGGILPGGETPVLPPVQPIQPESPEAISVDVLPEVDTSAPPCPPGKSRVDGVCVTMYPFEIRNDTQIEVSCIGDTTCIGAINACNTHYGGVYSGARTNDYVLCGDSNFSTGPASVITYANAPEGMFTAPPELSDYTSGLDTPPVVGSFEDSVLFAGSNTFVTPAFEENFNTYVEPFVVNNNADEQAILEAYGVTRVLFMVPQVETQQGATMSQVEARCRDLNGGEDNLVLESGADRVTSVTMYACLQ